MVQCCVCAVLCVCSAVTVCVHFNADTVFGAMLLSKQQGPADSLPSVWRQCAVCVYAFPGYGDLEASSTDSSRSLTHGSSWVVSTWMYTPLLCFWVLALSSWCVY
jgi:hypothetical protein